MPGGWVLKAKDFDGTVKKVKILVKSTSGPHNLRQMCLEIASNPQPSATLEVLYQFFGQLV